MNVHFTPEEERRIRRRTEAIQAQIQDQLLGAIKSWPLRTPARNVVWQMSAMTMAAQEAIERNGDCRHQVIMLTGDQVRCNMLEMAQHADDASREERQALKAAMWTRVAQLYNLLDAEVLIWLQDAWISSLTPEQEAAGEWEWPGDLPADQRREALHINVITPSQHAVVMQEYERTDDGVAWGKLAVAKEGGGAFLDTVMGQLVKEYRYLAPTMTVDGQRKRTAASRLFSGRQLLAELEKLGAYIAHIDTRYFNTN
jgi:hypothetical protein